MTPVAARTQSAAPIDKGTANTPMRLALAIDGRVVDRHTYRATHTGNFCGEPATGNPIEMRTIDIWRTKSTGLHYGPSARARGSEVTGARYRRPPSAIARTVVSGLAGHTVRQSQAPSAIALATWQIVYARIISSINARLKAASQRGKPQATPDQFRSDETA